MVERLPAMAADEPGRISQDDELVLLFGTVPEPGAEAQLSPEVDDESGGDVWGVPEADQEWYVIQVGDTLSSIAQDKLGSASWAPDLARLNQLSDPDQLTPGERIRLH